MNYNEIKFVSRNLPEEAVSYGPVRFSSSQFSVKQVGLLIIKPNNRRISC